MGSNRDRRKAERQRATRRRRPGVDPQAALKRLLADTARDGQREVTRELSHGVPDDALPATVADTARDFALRVIETSPDHGKHDCKAGCAYCCHTAVTIAVPEAVRIADYLRATLTTDELAAFRARFALNAKTAAAMSREAYISQRVPCGLLTSDMTCCAHPVRPIACAGFLSTSVAKCEALFRGDAGADPSPNDPYAWVAGLGVSYGLKQACAEAGLDGEFYELHHALLRALDVPDAGARWAKGEDVLAGCMR